MVGKSLKSVITFLLASSLCACGGGGGGGGVGGSEPLANPVIPTTPTGLSAQVVSPAQIDLGWNPATDDVAVLGYFIYRNGDTTTAVSTSYAVTGLTPATQYCFSVAAFDGDGNFSAQSASVCATTPATAPSAWTTVRSGTGNELSNIVWTGDKLVVVEETFGSSTTVHTSPDGLAWSRYPTSGFAFHGARDLVYGNNRFVAIDSWLFTSPDGVAWALHDDDLNFGDANALAWSPTLSLYVAVGDAGYIRTSADGSNWNTVEPAPTANGLFGVAWLNGRFYAAGEAGTILTSADGLTWNTAATPASSFALEGVAWNGQSGVGALYVATGYGTAFTSTDGDTWTAAAAPPPGFNDSVAWGGGSANCFVTVGSDNHVFSSSDGEIWTRRFLDTDPVYAQLSLNEVVWTGTRFVAVGEKGLILASENGADWRIVESGADLKGLAHDGSRFIAVGDNGRVVLSSDAGAWEYRHTGDDSHYLNDLVWDGGRYVAVGQAYSLYSGNLSGWQAASEGATSVDTAIIWDGSQFVRTGEYGVMTWDGVTLHSGTADPWWKWSFFDGSYLKLQDIIWTGSQFLAVGDNGGVYTSPDATETSIWTKQTSGTANSLRAVTQGTGRFVTVGAAGTILTSDDGGVTWATRNSGASTTLYDVTWTGNRFVAVGNSGLILTSTDGSDWAATNQGSEHLYSVLSSGTDTVIVGAKGTIIRNNQ